MARSLNRVTLLGHLGQDAEVKHTPSGVAVANFSLATSRRWKDKNSDEWKEETDWHKIVAWRVENLANYLLKGKPVLVEGRLQTRSYEDKAGEKRYVTEVVAENIILLGGGKDADSGGSGGRSGASGNRQGSQVPSDDDVPF
ncbi:MAG: single-stranded DNA-binding protein [Patescibacteria group bacterium]|nr:single-stranded DNA-binding protein [Patescibacteria group bacterium]